MSATVRDAVWLATSGMQAIWGYVFFVDPLLEDAEAAFAEGDAETTLECIAEALQRVAYCDAALAGYAGPRTEVEFLGVLPAYESDAITALRALRPIACTTMAEASVELDRLRTMVAAMKNRLPLPIPEMRTPEGFYPGLRLARELSALREKLGLESFPWDWSFT